MSKRFEIKVPSREGRVDLGKGATSQPSASAATQMRPDGNGRITTGSPTKGTPNNKSSS